MQVPQIPPPVLADELQGLVDLDPETLTATVRSLDEDHAQKLLYSWKLWARPDQLPPPGNWRFWMPLGGRGGGKTRLGAEFIRAAVEDSPVPIRIALIGESAPDVRDIMVEGESGILAVSPPWNRPLYEPSKRHVTWPNGSQAICFSGDKPDLLRGPQHHVAWCLSGDTMVLMGDGTQVRLDTIRVGDHVATRQGPRRVMCAELTRRGAEVYQLRTLDGRVIIGTGEHRIAIAGMGLVPINRVPRGAYACATNALSGVGKSGTYGARATTRHDLDFITPFGNRSMAPCQMATVFITSTHNFAAPGATPGSAPALFTLQIDTVEKLARRVDVYDLCVDGAHEFFANGLLVHNCDELFKFRYPSEVVTQLDYGLRLGPRPRAVITSTPRPIPLIKQLMADSQVVVTKASTYANIAHLSPMFIERIIRRHEGTRLGLQELYADLLEDVLGALWSHTLIEQHRVLSAPSLKRIVVGVDPQGSDQDRESGTFDEELGLSETGIVVAGLGEDDHGYVFDDLSDFYSPEHWAETSILAYKTWKANRIVAEANHGGAMVTSLIRTKDKRVACKSVRASTGKYTRAEPIAALYEQGRVHHVGHLGPLEDQMCTYAPADEESRRTHPDRMDALVWALHELMIEDDPKEEKFSHYDPGRHTFMVPRRAA